MRFGNVAFVFAILFCFCCKAPAADIKPSAQRVKEIAATLADKPKGLGPTIADRAAWKELGDELDATKFIAEANALRAKKLTPPSDELYLEYSQNGNRSHYQDALFEKYRVLFKLVVAECLENEGRFLPDVEKHVNEICDLKSWVLPAHDASLANFKGEKTYIDLYSAHVSWDLATLDYWLGDKLSKKTRKRIADELQRRTFAPFEKDVAAGKTDSIGWITNTSNWNAVCLANVTGAALTAVESKERRALFAAAAEKNIASYLSGFTPDGYCTEGLGYWNYGFGSYLLLASSLYEATGGKLDLVDKDQIRLIAQFSRRMEILPGVYPAIADAEITVKPSPTVGEMLHIAYGSAFENRTKAAWKAMQGRSMWLFELGALTVKRTPAEAAPSKEEGKTAKESGKTLPPRDWFPNAGVLICRPNSKNAQGLGASIKGGNNAEHHNHNDLGSFVVALGDSTPLVDPGREVYTARTFSDRRYESGVLNSFGHAAPRVAERLQEPGEKSIAKILKTKFGDEEDSLTMDLSSAYAVKTLKKLERTFIFSREGKGTLTVIDDVEFSSPEKFGAALITFAPWTQSGKNRLDIGEKDDVVTATITASDDAAPVIQTEAIKEDLGGPHPIRIGYDLPKPVVKAKLKVVIEPKK